MRASADLASRSRPGSAPAVALIVTPDEVATEEIAAWLSEDGHPVIACGGPCAPTYECPGTRGDTCALTRVCDVVVLDLRLETDTMMTGTPGWQMLLTYRAHGKPVVALTGPGDAVRIIDEPGVATVPRHSGRDALLRAVHSIVGSEHEVLTAGAGGRRPRILRLPTQPVADVADVRL